MTPIDLPWYHPWLLRSRPSRDCRYPVGVGIHYSNKLNICPIAFERVSVALNRIVEVPSKLIMEDNSLDYDSDRTWLVDYGHLVPTLIKGMQELSAENTALKSRLDAAGL